MGLVEFGQIWHCGVRNEMLRVFVKPKTGTLLPVNASSRGTIRLELWVALKTPLFECSSKGIRNVFIQGDFFLACRELSVMYLWQTK